MFVRTLCADVCWCDALFVGLLRIRCPRRIVARGHTRLPPPPPPLALRLRRPPLHSPPPPPLFSGGEHPPNSAVLGRTLCAAFPAAAWEGRRGAEAALVEQGDHRPTLTSPKPFPQRMGSTKQTFSFEILRPVRTPGSTVRCIYSAFMATPRPPSVPHAPHTHTYTSAPLTSVTRPPPPPPPHTLRLRCSSSTRPPPFPLQWASELMSDQWGRVGSSPAVLSPNGGLGTAGGIRGCGPRRVGAPPLHRVRSGAGGGDGDGPVAEGWRAVLLRNRAAGGGANVEPRGA